MNNTLEYKGYTGTVAYSAADDCLWGRVLGIRDVISYEGQSIDELRRDFQEMIDCYLEDCAAGGKTPDKPFCGSFTINIEPELQARLEQEAMEAGLSLSDFISARLATI